MSTHQAAEPRVFVLYNGERKGFHVNLDSPAAKLLESAIAAFDVTANIHLLSLFTSDNVELQDGEPLRAGGVKAGARLVMRPSEVKGG